MQLTISALEKKFDKTAFDCGYPLLGNYIKKQAKQDVSRDLSACFVLVDEALSVKGYYTLSANAVRRDDFPPSLQQKMPPAYVDLPVILLGRLAIDKTLKGMGYGEILLMDALCRSLAIADSLGTLAVVVDPINETAQHFYRKYGFILLPASGKMFLPVKTIRGL